MGPWPEHLVLEQLGILRPGEAKGYSLSGQATHFLPRPLTAVVSHPH